MQVLMNIVNVRALCVCRKPKMFSPWGDYNLTSDATYVACVNFTHFYIIYTSDRFLRNFTWLI